ncbi:MAG TPA: LytR C-terminal domain-containing protein [Solirubrobacterales bacterium]
MELIKDIGAFAGLAAFLGLAVLAMLSFAQGRDIRRLREWAGSAPERDTERKETTSEAAAERAEELRRLEEARTAEQEAAGLREERRRRREAGLPELTRSERLRETFKGSRSRLGEPRYLAALFAVFVIVAGGAAYLVTQGSDDAGKGGSDGSSSAKVRPSEIEVTVLNGTAVPGLAASYGDMVEGRGFELGAVTNSATSFVDSVVMFEPGKAREAHRVADALQISQVRAMTSDIASVSGGAPVAVIVGEDNATTAG